MSKRSRKKIPTEAVIASISQLNHEGRGVTHINQKTTFVFGALPNETVEFRYQACHRNYDEGMVTQVIHASPDRVKPGCAHFGVCGGCSLQHLSAEFQRQHKQGVLLEHLLHQAQCVPREILPPLFDKPWGYRRRARLSVKYVPKKNAVLMGFRERQSHFVADIKQCETLHPSIGHRIEAFSALLMTLDGKSDIPQIEITMGDDITAVIVRHLQPLSHHDQEKLIVFAAKSDWYLYFQPNKVDSIHCVYPKNPSNLSYRIPSDNIQLEFLPTQFTQINFEINVKMIARAIDLLALEKTDHVLDLFCGIGNFTLPIAKHCAHVTGVEGSETAIAQAKKNALANRIDNAEFYTFDLTQDCTNQPWMKKNYNKIILDPARAGAKEFLQLLTCKPARIVYISCNPITLARDAKHLLELGYHLDKAGVMDMFPHTEHIEAIALFTYGNHPAPTELPILGAF